jgi:hypothetical protein
MYPVASIKPDDSCDESSTRESGLLLNLTPTELLFLDAKLTLPGLSNNLDYLSSAHMFDHLRSIYYVLFHCRTNPPQTPVRQSSHEVPNAPYVNRS